MSVRINYYNHFNPKRIMYLPKVIKINILSSIVLFFLLVISSSASAQKDYFFGMGKRNLKKSKTQSKVIAKTDTTLQFAGDLFAAMDEQSKADDKNKTDIVTGIFKTTRLINGHSIENVGKGVLDVRISHRFGSINEGAYSLWGLDGATMRMGIDYGLTNRLMVGFGRSEYQKTFDGFVKYKILRQSTGKINMPISVSYAGSMHLRTEHLDDTQSAYYTDRLTFAHQLIIASKINDYLSLQFVPTMIHYNNNSQLSGSTNDYYSIGIGARQRVSKRVNLTYEYYARITKMDEYVNSLSIGIDIETGGHVFQFNLSNSTGVNERAFINETIDSWNNGGIHFGFNIARVFTIKKAKKII